MIRRSSSTTPALPRGVLRGLLPLRFHAGSLVRAIPCAAAGLAMIVALAATPAVRAQSDRDSTLHWTPPRMHETVPGISAKPACNLDSVLEKAGQRAEVLIDHLQSFDARERVRYENTDSHMTSKLFLTRKYDYQVDFGEPPAPLQLHETRTPLEQGDSGIDSYMDRGLAGIALVFHPTMQSDYEMKCEGYVERRGHGAWVVSFTQIEGRPSRAVALVTQNERFPVSIRGRAWIEARTGEVIHMETFLVSPKMELNLRSNATSVDYAPVKFKTKDVTLWLPQTAVVYANYGKTRTIIEHTFSNFQLFSVATRELVETPKPQP
jgi:hypothetical protein